ncbi:MAG TPA: hypothetical protein PKI01_05610 [Bacteroidales bacterium]|nr:hypothetical protein [Bacteroidales bacterium]
MQFTSGKIIVTLLLFFIFSYAEAQHKDGSEPMALYEIVKQQADSMGYYFVQNDFSHYMKFQHPGLVKLLGGEESLMKTLNENVTKKGIKAISVTTDIPSKIIVTDSSFQCTLQQTSVMMIARTKLEIISTLVCISYDKGERWFFVNASGSQSFLSQVLPELSPELDIQEQATRKLD